MSCSPLSRRLADEGTIERSVPAAAIGKLGIDPDKASPATV